jgi:hypothetical protein
LKHTLIACTDNIVECFLFKVITLRHLDQFQIIQ